MREGGCASCFQCEHTLRALIGGNYLMGLWRKDVPLDGEVGCCILSAVLKVGNVVSVLCRCLPLACFGGKMSHLLALSGDNNCSSGTHFRLIITPKISNGNDIIVRML